jgi:Core-2/I-Branching enzyme
VTELAAVVLAHDDPVHLHRLVAALDDVPVFLHCDARTAPSVFDAMTRRLPRRVTVCERIPTHLASWSLVRAELTALRQAVARTSAQHIVVMSGSDYPLVPMQTLLDELQAWRDRSYFRNVPLPFARWSPDGGLWRLQHRFVTRRDQVLHVRGIPLRWPVKRRVPRELTLRASSEWKIYARRHAELLLAVVDTRPDLLRFWRSTYIPEESFAASVLGSRALLGADALQPCLAQAWFMRWDPRIEHPRWLTSGDFDALAEARWALPAEPDVVTGDPGGDTTVAHARKLFARKFSTAVDTCVLDRIDAELRGSGAAPEAQVAWSHGQGVSEA